MTTPTILQNLDPATEPVVTETFAEQTGWRRSSGQTVSTFLARQLRAKGVTAVRVIFEDADGYRHESDFGTKELGR